MSLPNGQNSTPSLREFLQSMVCLDTLEGITKKLDSEIEDSKKIMSQIRVMLENPKIENQQDIGYNDLQQKDISQFLDADAPQLLLPDMAKNIDEVDLDNVLAIMKGYVEDYKYLSVQHQIPQRNIDKNMEKLDLQQYAASLEKLNKRVANIKTRGMAVDEKNAELEGKLTRLCEDVNMFTQMVQAMTTVSQSNENWSECEHSDNALAYDNVIVKLLSSINEVTYLLQNNKK